MTCGIDTMYGSRLNLALRNMDDHTIGSVVHANSPSDGEGMWISEPQIFKTKMPMEDK